MRIIYLILQLSLIPIFSAAQDLSDRLESVYNEVKTPYKYGMVVAPSDNYHKYDCPTVYKENGRWYMTYIVYNGKDGLDGRGYETWLACSDDLLNWNTLGRILSYRDSGWDCNQRGGFPSLVDWTWGGSYEILKYKGRHWMTYIGGQGTGYEAVNAPLNIGLAWTKGDISTAHEWNQYADKPLLSINDKDAQWWEKLVQYKSTIYWDKSKTLGSPFVMFYNAGGINPDNNLKAERIGIALSDNMHKWKRLHLNTTEKRGNPVFANEVGGIITGDAQIVKFNDLYVMFYFSAYDPSRKYNAYNTFAVSKDLINWEKWTGPDLISPSKPYDEMFAHKSYVLKHDGVVYHFYCAVNNDGQRGIAVATSVPLGKSAVSFPTPEKKGRRNIIVLDKDWTTWIESDNSGLMSTSHLSSKTVSVPHNHDDYYGYRQLKHGNLHGTALYKKDFFISKQTGKAYFLQFEGIGTYATVTVNGKQYDRTPVGRTTYTLEVTDALRDGDNNLLVKVEHPELINDMPWVCGGCSSEWGFSEGSQPFGIFRPVSLIETNEIRIEPFGVHVWNNEACDSIFIDTEIHNYSSIDQTIELVSKLNFASGKTVFRIPEKISVPAGQTKIVRFSSSIDNAHRWNLDDPYLYKLVSMIKDEGNKTVDEVETPFGIRTVSWPITRKNGDNRFLLNGKPIFINGTCEYEHILGGSHAFSDEQIESRVKMITQAGFNAFREAHQPHNLKYQSIFDNQGILFWSQFSAHIWYDTPAFRKNFKTLLRQWIKERRNSPSVVLWGLQNESVLPKEFAEECTALIKEMDPTLRPVTTCNGGEGTDWDVIQNWSGTYGGDASLYDKELKENRQLLNGEYGAWRTLGLHGDVKNSEDRFCNLLGMKATLAESASDSVCGHFQWLLLSHENPGRIQPDEGYRMVDKIGPLNYKGLFTIWEQPTDAFYMYRAKHVDCHEDPMVYLVSSDKYYSNCDSVVVLKSDNSLHAIGYVDGVAVAEDARGMAKPIIPTPSDRLKDIFKPNNDYHYILRLNCGGDKYLDHYGNIWHQDNPSFSSSWADRFNLSSVLASQQTFDAAIHGADGDDTILRSFRYGRGELKYTFPVTNGDYLVELYFTEPWLGKGGGAKTDCEGMRIFSVACNRDTVLRDVDVWAESGYAGVLKKTVKAKVNDGKLTITFPEVKSGQAIISAIAIASAELQSPISIPDNLPTTFWHDLENDTIAQLPNDKMPNEVDKYPAVKYSPTKFGKWIINPGVAKEYSLRFRYRNTTGKAVIAKLLLIDKKGVVLQNREITFPATPNKFKIINTTTGTQINAGKYDVLLENAESLEFDTLEIQ